MFYISYTVITKTKNKIFLAITGKKNRHNLYTTVRPGFVTSFWLFFFFWKSGFYLQNIVQSVCKSSIKSRKVRGIMDSAQGLKENHKGIQFLNINHIPALNRLLEKWKKKKENTCTKLKMLSNTFGMRSGLGNRRFCALSIWRWLISMFFSFNRTYQSLLRSSHDLRRSSEAFQLRPEKKVL